MNNKPIIEMPEYTQLYEVIAGVLDSAGRTKERACLFFAIAGAFLIQQVHKIPAHPVAGAAFYLVNEETGFTLAFGQLEANKPICDHNAFHCWIECNGSIIDLMAVIFPEAAISAGYAEHVARKAFQKPQASMAESPYALQQDGDFYLYPDLQMTKDLIQIFLSNPDNEALVTLCKQR
ncbi:MAG: DUF2026 family protein, partial [Candidatus Nanopelagicales bacterium]